MGKLKVMCKNPTCTNQAASGQVYCSRNCAPFGRLGGNATVSAKTGSSIYRERGEVSQLSSNVGPRTEIVSDSDTAPVASSEDKSLSEVYEGTNGYGLKYENANDDSGQTSRPSGDELSTKKETTHVVVTQTLTPSELPGSDDVTQHMDFVAPRVTTGRDGLAPLNLIDSTLQHLNVLLNSVAVDAPQGRRSDPDMVNAACNVAKNMRDLMKLKLDVVQVARSKNA